MTEIQILLSLGLAAATIVAALPLLRLPASRRVLAGIGGSSLMAIGAAAFGLLAGGFIAPTDLTSQAAAQEQLLLAARDPDGSRGNPWARFCPGRFKLRGVSGLEACFSGPQGFLQTMLTTAWRRSTRTAWSARASAFGSSAGSSTRSP